MNIDFNVRPGFSIYVLFLIISGVACIVLASPAVRRISTGLRVWNVLVGLGMLGYGIYLGFIFGGGHYVIFFYAFILPILTIIRTLKARSGPTPHASPAQSGQSH